jgi:diguanylate cyclase (GGDEF)-like protein/PAS domain S-box-containing protein
MTAARSLHARFVVAVVWTALALGMVAALAVYRVAQAHLHESGLASVKALISAIEKTSAIGAYAGDKVLLRELADGLTRHPHVARTAVLGAAGETLVSSTPLEPRSPASAAEPHQTAASIDHALMSPFDATESVGRLQVWIDEQTLSAQARQQALTLVIALIVLLAGMLLAFNALALRLLSRPMHTLATALSQMQPGTADRIELHSAHQSDEVGTVTHAANRLLDLQQRALDRERALRAEIAAMEARYRGIFDSTSAGIFILSPQGRLIHGNPALGRLLGAASGDIDAALHDDFAARTFCQPALLAGMAESARSTEQPVAADLELRRLDGSVLWVHGLVSVHSGDGPDQGRIEGVLYDVSQRKLAEKLALHRAEHDALTGLKSRAFIEASLDQRVDIARHSDGTVTLMFVDLDGFKAVNDRWGHAAGDAVLIEAAQRLRALFKRSNDIVGRLGGDELVVVLEGLRAGDTMVRALARELIESFKAPFELPGGQLVHVGASVGVASYPQHATDAGTLIRAADAAMYAVKQSGKGGFVIATDSAAAEDTGAGARSAAPAAATPPLHDPLTGLPDRRLLNDRLSMALERARRRRQFGAVICVDIDHFKNINLARGPQAGDELLREAAGRFCALLRGEDTIARTGSDEFVIVIDACGRDHAQAAPAAVNAARKLLASAAAPFMLTGGAWSAQASAGVSLLGPETPDAVDVLREAQLALRRAKAQERGGVALFDSGMMAGFQQRLALESDLRAAIGSDQLRLHLQIQTRIEADGRRRPAGAEALLRWLHPQRGWVPPDQFIPLAESTGSIVDLGRWVLEEGCRVLARMARTGVQVPLAINISPAQFQHADFVAHVRGALEASGARPQQLILEITENLLISRIDATVQQMQALAALGVRFSIDDFGTGFSSLGYLRRLPLHEIKIDRSFVAGLPGDAASVGIVHSILAMGSHLGLHVVAEGVETAQQAQFLDQHGCDAQQGWLHGRPEPVDDWLQRLATPPAHGQADPSLAATVDPA